MHYFTTYARSLGKVDSIPNARGGREKWDTILMEIKGGHTLLLTFSVIPYLPPARQSPTHTKK